MIRVFPGRVHAQVVLPDPGGLISNIVLFILSPPNLAKNFIKDF